MTVIVPLAGGGVPKGDLISMAYEDCRLAGFDFDRTPEESLMALRRLEAMMAEWPWNLLGYAPGGSEADLSNLPEDTVHGVAQMLALRLMTAFGKEIPSAFRATAAQSINYLRSVAATVPRIKYAPGTIRGAGARHNNTGPFFPDYSQEDEWLPQGDPGDLAGIATS